MSWFGGYKPTPKPKSEEDLRKEKRDKLIAERIARAEKRLIQKRQLEAALKARQEADKALQEFLDIDPNIFAGDDYSEATDKELELL